jgi:hypothetical protein
LNKSVYIFTPSLSNLKNFIMIKFICTGLIGVLILFSFQFELSSCTKTNTITKTDTVIQIQKDTITIKDTALTPAILTANSWKYQEIRATFGGSYIYYLRGGSNNTQSFDNEYVTFNSDHTGLYSDNAGGQTTLTWNFTDASNTTLVWIWNVSPTPVTVTWEHLSFKNGAIHYDEFFTQNGENELSSATRVPK